MGISFLTILVFYLPSDSGEKVCSSIVIGIFYQRSEIGLSVHGLEREQQQRQQQYSNRK